MLINLVICILKYFIFQFHRSLYTAYNFNLYTAYITQPMDCKTQSRLLKQQICDSVSEKLTPTKEEIWRSPIMN